MPRVYVAGPVLPAGPETRSIWERMRRTDHSEMVAKCYRGIAQAAESVNGEVQLPHPDPELMRADSVTFCESIATRIHAADAVVFVFEPSNLSGPVESAMAAFAGKKQLVLVAKGVEVPRLIRGMPGVVRVVEFDDREIPVGHITAFLRDISVPEPPLSSPMPGASEPGTGGTTASPPPPPRSKP